MTAAGGSAGAGASGAPMDHLPRVVKGAAINLGGNLAGKVLTLAYTILLTRVLTQGEVGLFYLALTLFQLVTSISLLGWDSGVLRYVPIFAARGDRARMNGTVRLALGFAGGLGVLLALALAAFAGPVADRVFHAPAFRPVVLAFAPAIPFFVAASVQLAGTQALGRMQYQVYVRQLAEPLLKLVLTAAFLLAGIRLWGVVLSFTLGTILAAALARHYQARLYRQAGVPTVVPAEWREMLTFSLPQTFSRFFLLLILWTDTLVLGMLGTEEQVGMYSVASRTAILGMIFLDAFSVMFAPMISELYEREARAELELAFKSVTKWGFALSWPLLLVFLTLPRQVLGVYGEGYAAASACLAVLTVAQVVGILTGPVGQMIVMSGRAWLNLANNLAVAALNVLLCWLLIPPYGVVGAAVATTTSIAVLNLWRLFEVRSLMKLSPFQRGLWKPAVAGVLGAAAAAGLVPLLADLPGLVVLIAGSATLAAVYAAALALFGVDEEDRFVLQRIRGRLAALRG